MYVNKDNWYDVTVECDNCHDLHYCEIQLYSKREVAVIKEVLDKLFTRCSNCGAGQQEFSITVYEATFTPDEIQKLNEDNENNSPLFEIID